ncbi:MAG: hypothetical protein ACE5F5_12175, partial [Acidimicrobiia bacterium]
FRRLRGDRPGREPHLSFGSWDRLEAGAVVQVCHPDWRGIRTVAYGFATPVIECDDLTRWSGVLVDGLASAGCVVVQGWPPGAAGLVRALAARGIRAKAVLHSSPAQHGAEPGEAAVVDEVLSLAAEGVLAGVGMGKDGVAAAFTALGHPVTHVPNRVPQLPNLERRDLGEGLHVGVFAEPFWRKNVTTQLLATALLDRSVAHVMTRPANTYLDSLSIVEHGELPWAEFVSLQGSVDLNLYVTLSECHPSTPQESYLAGVPCLISRVSSVFKDDPELWELTTVDEADNPEAIAAAARRLLDHRDEAITRAKAWMAAADSVAAALWESFVSS